MICSKITEDMKRKQWEFAQDAELCSRQAAKGFDELLGSAHPGSLNCRLVLAETLVILNRFDEALLLYEAAKRSALKLFLLRDRAASAGRWRGSWAPNIQRPGVRKLA